MMIVPGLTAAQNGETGASPGVIEQAPHIYAYDPDAPYVPGEVLVKLKDTMDRVQADSLAADHGCRVEESIATIQLYRMEILSEAGVWDVAAGFAQDPGVEYAEPNFIDYPVGVPARDATLPADFPEALPSDPQYEDQWHYPLIHMPDAWNVTTGGADIIVGVVDSGITSHPDVMARVSANGYDFIDNDTNPTDPGGFSGEGHGTHVSGTIGAITNNALGVSGVTWTGTILPVRVLGVGGGSHFQMAQGFRYAAGLLTTPDPVNPTPAQVLNYSGGGSHSATKEEAVSDVHDAGVIMCCAAGNDYCGSVIYPAAYSPSYAMVIAVGATDYNYPNLPVRAPYSNCGPEINVVAPGGDTGEDSDLDGNVDGVLSTTWDYGSNSPVYEFWQGTSMATPHVTGVVALMLAQGIDAANVRGILQNTALDLGTAGFDNQYGWGLIDAAEALRNHNQLALIETRDTTDSVRKALTEMGWGFDFYQTDDFSGIDLSPYGTVIVAMDGGNPQDASIQNLANFANNGGNLVMLGGSSFEPFALAVDAHLLDIDETNYFWEMGYGTPDMRVIEPFHQLAGNLLSAHEFDYAPATWYMIRSQDPAAEEVAVNGHNVPCLLKKKLGEGTLSWFINSPYDSYWSNTADYDLLKQVIDNCMGVSFPSPDYAPRGLAWALDELWNVNSGDGSPSSLYGKTIYEIYPATGAPVGYFDTPKGATTPAGIAFDGTYLWHSDFGTGYIYRLDRSDLHVVSSFPSPRPWPADLAWDGKYLWAAILQTGPIIRINPKTGAEEGYIPAPGKNPRPFGLTYANGYLYVGDDGTNTIYKVSPRTGAVVNSWPAPGTYPAGLAFDGRYLWVSDFFSHRIYRMDIAEAPCECDLNHDGRCDMQDWLAFGEDWGRTDCPSQPPYCAIDQEQLVDNYGYWFELDLVRWQEFLPDGNRICRVEVEIDKRGDAPGDVLLAIENSVGTTIWSATVPGGSVPAGRSWVSVDVSGVKVNPGGSYKLTVTSDGDSIDPSHRYFWRSSNTDVYPGISSVGTLADFTFRTYKDTTCECDLNHDGRCDMQDWLLFGGDWGRTNCPKPEGFFENFDYGEAPNWVDDGSGTWSIEDFVLKMTGSSPASSTVRYSIYDEDFDDFTYQVSLMRTQGDLNTSHGMTFRGDGTYQNTYVFHLAADGQYLIYKLVGGSATWLIPGWTYSSAIHQGLDVWNTLKVVCSGSTMEFYINDILVESLVDSQFSSGQVGVKAYDVSYDSNVKLFDNATLTLADGLSGVAAKPAASIPASGEESEENL
jgi:subtilisin family serine protease